MSFQATIAATLGVERRTPVLACQYFGPLPHLCVATLASASKLLEIEDEVFLEVTPTQYMVLHRHQGEPRIAFGPEYDLDMLNQRYFSWSVIDAVLPAELNPEPLKSHF